MNLPDYIHSSRRALLRLQYAIAGAYWHHPNVYALDVGCYSTRVSLRDSSREVFTESDVAGDDDPVAAAAAGAPDTRGIDCCDVSKPGE